RQAQRRVGRDRLPGSHGRDRRNRGAGLGARGIGRPRVGDRPALAPFGPGPPGSGRAVHTAVGPRWHTPAPPRSHARPDGGRAGHSRPRRSRAAAGGGGGGAAAGAPTGDPRPTPSAGGSGTPSAVVGAAAPPAAPAPAAARGPAAPPIAVELGIGPGRIALP